MSPARAAELRRIETEVGVLIQRVKRIVGDRARQLHPDLHPMTYLLLTHVINHGPVRAADLATDFGMDKGGVSRQIQHLTDLGFIDRTPDPADRRALLLAATDLARGRVTELQQARSAQVGKRLADWTDDDLAGFAEQLAAYNRALSD
jgi:DNA-binding MarR family transcriptional regulator